MVASSFHDEGNSGTLDTQVLLSRLLPSLLLSILISLVLEDAAIKDPADILLAHDAVIGPEQKVDSEP